MQLVDNPQEERRLVKAAQADPRRFADLYDLHFERVYAYVARRVANRAAAEDVTSEVFHQALANIGRFQWRGTPFAAWLYRIASNAIADRWRREARERGNPAGEAQALPAPEMEDVERRAAVAQLVAQLPQDQQRVVRMRFAEERSIREIAQAMGRSEGAVKQLQFRALEALRAHVSKKNG